MAFELSHMAANSNGGTEQLVRRLVKELQVRDVDLSDVQIIVSRLENKLDPGKIRIMYCHDLAKDPAAESALGNGRWADFDLIVFVSNWQMQQYNTILGVPYAKSVVIENFVDPLEYKTKTLKRTEPFRLIYTPTPHRGLEILVPAIDRLIEKGHNLHLDVFSSFKLYGWEQRDEQYEKLFDICRNHANITYHGTQPHEVVREAVANADIFAYPSIWPETSCLCLIEAMSAGLICVHPNYGALPDTAMAHTKMYQWSEDPQQHLQTFVDELDYVMTLSKRFSFFFNDANDFREDVNVRFSPERAANLWAHEIKKLVDNKEQVLAHRRAMEQKNTFSFRIP